MSAGVDRAYAGEVRDGVYDPVSGMLRGRLKGEEHIPAGGVCIRNCNWIRPWRPRRNLNRQTIGEDQEWLNLWPSSRVSSL
jgi:hypothetical protein